MNVLIFEWKNFGIEDICDAFKDMAIKYKCISTELMRERKNEEFDNIFENEMSIKYDCVFTFNYYQTAAVVLIFHILLLYMTARLYLYIHTPL